MSELLMALRIAAVPHGFRSSFRDWAAEETDHPREVAEAALAHKVRNQVEAAYRRSVVFPRGIDGRERPPERRRAGCVKTRTAPCPYQGLEEGGRSRPPPFCPIVRAGGGRRGVAARKHKA